FGIAARTLTAPAALARASGAPIVPTRCVRTADGRYALLCERALELDASLPRALARTALLAELNATYERWIRASPEQWAWHQKRWPSDCDTAAPDPRGPSAQLDPRAGFFTKR